MSNFEPVSHPVKAFATYLAGDRLQKLQHGMHTVRSEWQSGKHPRDVLQAALTQHASPETQFKLLAAWAHLEKWWNVNAKQQHTKGKACSCAIERCENHALAPRPSFRHKHCCERGSMHERMQFAYGKALY